MPSAAESSFEVLAKAVDDAAAEVAKLDEVPRRAAEELRAAVEAAHRAGLVTIVRGLRADDAGRALLYELVDDPLIRMLFSLHAIIRTDTPAGVGAAGEHSGAPSGHQHGAHEHGASGQPSGGCGTSAGGGCGCGQSAGGGCGDGHGVSEQAGPAIIPLSAIRLRPPLDLLPGGGA